jgi:hypothetical protein
MIPDNTNATKKPSKLPIVAIAPETIVIKPAAGPETPNFAPLIEPTTTPPIIPAIIPEKSLVESPVEARAIPQHKGRATK